MHPLLPRVQTLPDQARPGSRTRRITAESGCADPAPPAGVAFEAPLEARSQGPTGVQTRRQSRPPPRRVSGRITPHAGPSPYLGPAPTSRAPARPIRVADINSEPVTGRSRGWMAWTPGTGPRGMPDGAVEPAGRATAGTGQNAPAACDRSSRQLVTDGNVSREGDPGGCRERRCDSTEGGRGGEGSSAGRRGRAPDRGCTE